MKPSECEQEDCSGREEKPGLQITPPNGPALSCRPPVNVPRNDRRPRPSPYRAGFRCRRCSILAEHPRPLRFRWTHREEHGTVSPKLTDPAQAAVDSFSRVANASAPGAPLDPKALKQAAAIELAREEGRRTGEARALAEWEAQRDHERLAAIQREGVEQRRRAIREAGE